jgi:hypothetical protein
LYPIVNCILHNSIYAWDRVQIEATALPSRGRALDIIAVCTLGVPTLGHNAKVLSTSVTHRVYGTLGDEGCVCSQSVYQASIWGSELALCWSVSTVLLPKVTVEVKAIV